MWNAWWNVSFFHTPFRSEFYCLFIIVRLLFHSFLKLQWYGSGEHDSAEYAVNSNEIAGSLKRKFHDFFTKLLAFLHPSGAPKFYQNRLRSLIRKNIGKQSPQITFLIPIWVQFGLFSAWNLTIGGWTKRDFCSRLPPEPILMYFGVADPIS